MPDAYAEFPPGISSPLSRSHAIPAGAPSSAIELPFTSRAVMVDGAGVFSATDASGNNFTITNPARGVLHPIRITHVLTSNTAALVIWD